MASMLTLTLGLWLVSGATTVAPSSPDARQVLQPTDGRLQTLVEAALAADPIVESFDIVVTVVDGEVLLNGAVDTKDERARAGSVTADIDGVHEVDNRITVETSLIAADKSDEEIQREIVSHVAATYPGAQVRISVHHGFATFTGVVRSREIHLDLTEIAFDAGALLVKNETRINENGGATSGEQSEGPAHDDL